MPSGHIQLGSFRLDRRTPATREAWSPILIGDEFCLLYGPRFGRFYLLGRTDGLAPFFLRLIGLADDHTRRNSLCDPATLIAKTRRDFDGSAADRPCWQWRIGYTMLGMSRHLLPLRLMAKILRIAASRVRPSHPPGDTVALAASLLYAVESAQAMSDCYPRALMSAFLFLKSGRSCVLTIGALAPTRKMHVWCSVDGTIPYEPSPEHYLYQPLWTMTLTP